MSAVREPMVGDTVGLSIEVGFEVVGVRRPSARQLEWLFERLHEADVLAARVLLQRQDRSSTRMDAEEWLVSDDQAPQTEYVLYENPGVIRRVIVGTLAAAALFSAMERTLVAAEGTVHAATHLVQAAHELKGEIEQFVDDDPNRDQALRVLYGHGHDPEIRIVRIDTRVVN